MPTVTKALFRGAATTTVGTTLYTVPAATTTVVSNIVVTNTAATAATADLAGTGLSWDSAGTQFNGFWITGAGIPAIVAVTPGTTTVISTGAISASPKLRVAKSMATALKISANSWIVIGDIS